MDILGNQPGRAWTTIDVICGLTVKGGVEVYKLEQTTNPDQDTKKERDLLKNHK